MTKSIAVLFFVVALAVTAAWWRGGVFDLPSVPPGIKAYSAGLHELDEKRQCDAYLGLGSPSRPASISDGPSHASWSPSHVAAEARVALLKIEGGEAADGLAGMQQALRGEPTNLVLGNAYRMAAFSLRRNFLRAARIEGILRPEFPPFLKGEPIGFLGELVQTHPCRETKLQLALAWVDQMLLFPALEIKAPSSVEAVRILDEILAAEPYYVPALYARGLNHLHRPARLVWPETEKVAVDAAARDVGLCVAIGRKVGAGSARLKATMAMVLGDAHVKAGKSGQARSWWQIAQNLCHERGIQESIRRRFGWRDETILDDLETDLDRARAELDRPMTDLAFMWN